MITRRDYLKLTAAAAAALMVNPGRILADDRPVPIITRSIPGTDEHLPVIGLGSSASFSRIAGEGKSETIREILVSLVQHGGSVFDTAPSYGAAEEVAGRAAQDTGLAEKIFWATKLNVAGRSGGSADVAAARAQIEQSFARVGKPVIDLIQVHNLGDVPTQLDLLKEYRDAGRIRYVGVTTTFPRQYDELEQLLKKQSLDFIGVDYAIDNRVMEERIFPLAQDRGVAVMVYQPFGRTRLWQRVDGHALPDWTAEYDISSWGQFFLKFALSHPAVTVVTPATSRVGHLVDNLGAATGYVPDQDVRHRMIRHIDSLV